MVRPFLFAIPLLTLFLAAATSSAQTRVTPEPRARIEADWKTWWKANERRFDEPHEKDAEASPEAEALRRAAVRRIAGYLDHGRAAVRAAAALALGRAGRAAPPEAHAPLLAMTSDQDASAAEAALLALGLLKSAGAAPSLLKLLGDPGGLYRRRTLAAVALGLIGDQGNAPLLCDLAFKTDEQYQVRAGCMIGLALMEHEPSVPALVKCLGDRAEEEGLRAMAATALGMRGLPEFRRGTKRANVLDSLVRILSSETRARKLKVSAILAVSEIGPGGGETPEKLTEILGRLYASERSAAVRSLLLVGIAELARQGLARDKASRIFHNVLVAESNRSLLAFACLVAGLSGDRETLEPVRKIFLSEKNTDLRSAAALALGLLKDLESAERLLEALGEKGEVEMTRCCCAALGLMGPGASRDALPEIARILAGGGPPELMSEAAQALTRLCGTPAAVYLFGALHGVESAEFKAVLPALGRTRDPAFLPLLLRIIERDESLGEELLAVLLKTIGDILGEPSPALEGLRRLLNPALDDFDAFEILR